MESPCLDIHPRLDYNTIMLYFVPTSTSLLLHSIQTVDNNVHVINVFDKNQFTNQYTLLCVLVDATKQLSAILVSSNDLLLIEND